jgi:hypothetical protein
VKLAAHVVTVQVDVARELAIASVVMLVIPWRLAGADLAVDRFFVEVFLAERCVVVSHLVLREIALRCTCRCRLAHIGEARALQSIVLMPRKQRFKPSRKPQPAAPVASANPQVSDRQNIQGDVQDIEKAVPERANAPDVEGESY